MTMQVTMTIPRRSEDGLSVLLNGATYTVGDDFGKQLVQMGAAVDTAGVIAATAIAQRDDLLDGEVWATRALVGGDGSIVTTSGAVYGLAEVSPYVSATPSAGATVFPGACELAGWYCSVAAGTITIYDALSATGTPIVPATALVVGPMPIFGAGTNGKLALTTGCHVVLSGAATVRMLVG